MEDKSLKAAVLAKCGKLAPKKHDLFQFEDKSGYVRKSMLSNKDVAWEIYKKVWNDDGNSGKIVTSISLFESLPANHVNWPLAAEILGIKPKEARPSNDLLWEAWKAALRSTGMEEFSIETTYSKCAFDAWKMNVATDPLEADRAILRQAYGKVVSPYFYRGDSKKFFESYKRLAGMEVKNG